MTSESHPKVETLHLWQTGELEPQEQREVQKHLDSCLACCETLAGFDALYSEAKWADTTVASRSMRARLMSHTQRDRWVRLSWAGAIAAVLIASLILFTTTDLTPSAHAETLLNQAMGREAETPFRPHILRIESGSEDCNVTWARPEAPFMETAAGKTTCGSIKQHLQSAGWSWNTPLSARNFQQWRSSLSHKHDQVRKLSDVTEVSTRTDEGPIREAMLRVRNSDYKAVAAKVQLAATAPNSFIEIDEIPYTPTEVAERIHQSLDRSEAAVRLALHHIGADTNVLLAVDRQQDDIRVWGVVPNRSVKASVTQMLIDVPHISLAVLTESEQQASQAPLPWQGAHSTALPLAYDQVNDVYKNDSNGRQSFLNDLDAITRRMVGEAKSRDLLLALAARTDSSEGKAPLYRAAADLEERLLADQRLLRQRLQPVYAAFHQSLPEQSLPLNYRQASETYLLLHQLFLANNKDGPVTADEAFVSLEKLPL